MDMTYIFIAILTSIIVPSVPFLFYAVYRSSQVPAIWKRVDGLTKEKAEDIDMKMLDGRLRKMELDFSNLMGRLSGILDRFEIIESKMENKMGLEKDKV